MKIIVFIDPRRFSFLFKNINAFIPKFEDEQNDENYLSNNLHLVYIADNQIETGDFDENKCDTANIIILYDNYEFNYSPNEYFKLIYHGRTSSENLSALEKHDLYKGKKADIEEMEKDGKETIYYELAKLITGGPTEAGIKAIYDKIPESNSELEAKLTLLHQCLTPEDAQNADTSLLTEEQRTIVNYLKSHKDCLAKDYIKKLTELRISLLGS